MKNVKSYFIDLDKDTNPDELRHYLSVLLDWANN